MGQPQQQTPSVHPQRWCSAVTNTFPKTLLGPAKSFTHWCWTFLFLSTQLGNCNNCSMWESKGRPHKTVRSNLHLTVQMEWSDWIKKQLAVCKKPARTFDEKLERLQSIVATSIRIVLIWYVYIATKFRGVFCAGVVKLYVATEKSSKITDKNELMQLKNSAILGASLHRALNIV